MQYLKEKRNALNDGNAADFKIFFQISQSVVVIEIYDTPFIQYFVLFIFYFVFLFFNLEKFINY